MTRKEAQHIRSKPKTDITDALMLIDTRQASFDMREISNRRFMYQAQTGTLILGYQHKGGRLVSSHAGEHFDSGAKEPFDSFVRGWVGTGKEYKNGVIHFAPNISADNIPAFEQAFSALAMFNENHANGDTVVRGFGRAWEQPLSNIITERNDQMDDTKTYSAYDHDKLEPADSMKIERIIYFEAGNADISALTALSLEQLRARREESAAAEQAIYDNLREQAAAWEEQAGKTLLLDKAIEYARTPEAEHTANEWQAADYDRHTISNRVYQMSYHIYENTRYDSDAKQSIPYSWTLSWSVHTNSPDRYRQAKIAGQDRKVFADKAAMEKYLNGRIKAYQHLFTELTPPIPQAYANNFKVNGHLLPGYTIEGAEPNPPERATDIPASINAEQQTERESVISDPQPRDADPEKVDMEAAAATLAAEPPQPRPVVPIVLAAEKPAEKIKEITDKLEAGIQAVLSSEQYAEYLKAMSKFHNYSFNNAILIAMQGGNLVKGFRQWEKEFDRHVKKGEKGIKILAPAPFKVKQQMEKIDPDTQKPVLGKDGQPLTEEKEITIPAYKVVTVFDVSQTEGKELPDIAAPNLVADVEQYDDFYKALEKSSPAPIAFEKIESGANGYYSLEDKRIAINEGMSQLQNIKTAIHEIAHATLHDIDKNAPKDAQQNRPDRNTREVQAESVAYTVCQHFGLDTSEYSFAYVAGWSSGKEMAELKASLETIQEAAKELITKIEGHFTDLQQQREAAGHEQNAGIPTPVFDKLPPEKQREMSDTVKSTLQMLIDTDMRVHGKVTENTLAAIAVQGYAYKDGSLDKLAATPQPEQDIDSFSIYQLKGGNETRDLRFEPYERLQAAGLKVDAANYEHIYTAPLESGMTLDSIFQRFNIDRPADFSGHSLSISDVIVLHQDGQDAAHYVDRYGDFQKVPEFLGQPQELIPDAFITGEKVKTPRGSFSLTGMTREQIEAAGYGFHHQPDDGKYHIMANGTRAFAIAAAQPENYLKHVEDAVEQNDNSFDGLINNAPMPTVAELEAKVNAGEAISLVDLAKAVKAEKHEKPQKKPSVLKQLDKYKEQAKAQQRKQPVKEKQKDLEV